MKLNINRNSVVGISEQIFSQIENRIKSGSLKAGRKLPSIRKLSEELGISHMTIVKVYDRLTKVGLIEKIHGKGSFVKSPIMEYTASQVERGYGINRMINGEVENDGGETESWQDEIQDYVANASFRYIKNLSPRYSGCNLSIAALGQGYLPLEKIFRGFNRGRNDYSEFGKYPPIEGDIKMREAVTEYIKDRNVYAGVENTLIASGSQIAINLVAMTFIGPGDIVVVEAPTYPGAIDIFKNRGAHIIEVNMEEDGMDTYELLSLCEMYNVKMVYTMPNFQNPTGAVMSLEKKQMLLELAQEHNFLILEDDIWSTLSYEGTVEPLKALDKGERVIYVCGFSKVYGPAYKLSAIIASGSLYTRMAAAKSNLDFGTSLISQKLLEPYLNSLEDKQFIISLKYRLKKIRDNIYEILKKNLPSQVRVSKPKGGIVFWLTFPKGFNCQVIHYRAASEENISFLPGAFCYSDRRGDNQMRICFSFVSEEEVIDAVMRLCRIINEKI